MAEVFARGELVDAYESILVVDGRIRRFLATADRELRKAAHADMLARTERRLRRRRARATGRNVPVPWRRTNVN